MIFNKKKKIINNQIKMNLNNKSNSQVSNPLDNNNIIQFILLEF